MRGSEFSVSVVWWSVVKCSEVLQCSDGTSNKVSSIIRRRIRVDSRKLLLICILLLSHFLLFFRFLFYQYMVVFLFNTVIYVFLLQGLGILIVRLPWLRFCSKIAWDYWLRLLSSQTFFLINTPTFLKPSHSSHLPAYEDGTGRVLQNVGIYLCKSISTLQIQVATHVFELSAGNCNR